jgi:restriction endonuclease S subunit
LKTTIQNIASIRTGLFAKPTKQGDIAYLQMRHFDESGILREALYPDLPTSVVSPKHLLIPGDILYAAKGSKNFAAVYTEHQIPAVASTSFFVLTIHDHIVSSAYVAWYLNNPSTQSLLKLQAKGTSIPSVSKESLEQLEIFIPPLEAQQKIITIDTLQHRESNLLARISELKEINTQLALQHYIKSHS